MLGHIATREEISALFARVAFGAQAADLDQWAGKPYALVVEHLLDVPAPGVLRAQPDDAARLALFAVGGQADSGVTPKLEAMQGWWLERMRTTRWPLLERMTLFWHSHWATAYGPYPDAGMMLGQNETLRTHALGSFTAMVNAMNIDPAMLWWLNGVESHTPKPNENYAREFFELFTLGKDPQVYTEQDIREAARAFTGWTSFPMERRVAFVPEAHDQGVKRVLGVDVPDLGEQEHERITEVALSQRAASEFIARKLVMQFAWVPQSGDPLVAKVAAALRTSGFDVAAGMRTLLLADEFRAPAPQQRHVRPPVDVMVHACKALGVPFTSSLTAVNGILARMGQRLFKPPNVGGWVVGRDWLTPATMLARYDMAFTLFPSHEVFGGRAMLPASDDLDAWAARFGLAGLSPTTAEAIRDHLAEQNPAISEEVRQMGVFALLMTSPDWMVV